VSWAVEATLRYYLNQRDRIHEIPWASGEKVKGEVRSLAESSTAISSRQEVRNRRAKATPDFAARPENQVYDYAVTQDLALKS
jgi:hypothetical protein